VEDSLDLRDFDWSLLGDLVVPRDAGTLSAVPGEPNTDSDSTSPADLRAGICPVCGRSLSWPQDPMWKMLRTFQDVLMEGLDGGETEDQG
jgi:hypothetical protein